MTHTTNDDSTHRSRGWICTLNNYTEIELAKVITFADEKAQYACVGKEVGKTGTPHLQIYFQMKAAYAGQSIKNQTSKRMWCGIANSPSKSRKYCQKEGDYMEFGEFKDTIAAKAKGSKAGGASTKAKWAELLEKVKAGVAYEDLLTEYPSMVMQTRNAILAECIRHAPKRKFKTCVHVYIGESGAGKTTRATVDAPDAFMVTPGMNHWFDGYNGRDDVIVDEMRKGQYSLGTLLSMMDQHPCSVQVKGGMVNFAPRKLIITSNLPPSNWYTDETLDFQSRTALWRRINVCKYFEKTDDLAGQSLRDYEEGFPLYGSGCLCPTAHLEDTLCLDSSAEDFPEELVDPTPQLDLTNSEFVPTAVATKRLEAPGSPPPSPKKQKVFPRIPGKPISKLTRQLAMVLDDSSEDDIEDFSSCDTGDVSDSLSQEF